MRIRRLAAVLFAACVLLLGSGAHAQDELPAQPEVVASTPPEVPKGVEVLARGPVHEAFASLSAEAAPTATFKKRPPAPLEELPPGEKPEGDMIWIGGYWAWDDDREDFLWVSGIWRAPPPGKQWIAGYWREGDNGWQWVPGFWAAKPKSDDEGQQLTYLPPPPATPDLAPPGEPPSEDTFYVPGYWVWNGTEFVWRSGYWARVQPGHVWVAAHYRWTPSGCVFVPGYWDLDVSSRGILYAPVVVDAVAVGPRFVYTPTYIVRETVVVDSLWVRPSHCHYYFGDYYGVTYSRLGFESGVVYSRKRYDSIVVYERYRHRHVHDWERNQVNIYLARHEERAPRPPRTLVQQTNVIQQNVTNVTNVTNVKNTTNVVNAKVSNTEVLTTSAKLAKDKGVKTVALDAKTREQAAEQSRTVREVSAQRNTTEKATTGRPARPKVASLTVPPQKPIAPVARPAAPVASVAPSTSAPKENRPATPAVTRVTPKPEAPKAPTAEAPRPPQPPVAAKAAELTPPPGSRPMAKETRTPPVAKPAAPPVAASPAPTRPAAPSMASKPTSAPTVKPASTPPAVKSPAPAVPAPRTPEAPMAKPREPTAPPKPPATVARPTPTPAPVRASTPPAAPAQPAKPAAVAPAKTPPKQPARPASKKKEPEEPKEKKPRQ